MPPEMPEDAPPHHRRKGRRGSVDVDRDRVTSGNRATAAGSMAPTSSVSRFVGAGMPRSSDVESGVATDEAAAVTSVGAGVSQPTWGPLESADEWTRAPGNVTRSNRGGRSKRNQKVVSDKTSIESRSPEVARSQRTHEIDISVLVPLQPPPLSPKGGAGARHQHSSACRHSPGGSCRAEAAAALAVPLLFDASDTALAESGNAVPQQFNASQGGMLIAAMTVRWKGKFDGVASASEP